MLDTYPSSLKTIKTKTDTSLFSTPEYQIMAADCVATISTPATARTELNRNIASVFDELQSQGVDKNNIILMGAIPFDDKQHSSLKVYVNHSKALREQHPSSMPNPVTSRVEHKSRITTETQFKNGVNKALTAFETQKVKKVVLSQSLDVTFSHKQSPLLLAEKLINNNPDAFTFAIPVSDEEYLVGASPELLLARDALSIKSNPLAGSAKRTSDSHENLNYINDLLHSKKDNYEHRIVVDYVSSHLAPYCSSLEISESPYILKTPTMLHLSSLIKGRLRQGSPDALNLALDLHPTPAVCGMPTDLAKAFITENEGYDRGFYTGLVGWMDGDGNGEWVVTIRCGLLNDKRVRLYAGAGIVEGSDASAEWRETESKQRTMLDVLSPEHSAQAESA